MAYGSMYRKRAGRRYRRGRGRARAILLKKPTAGNQRKQIYSLSKGLSQVQRQLNASMFYGTYRCNHFNALVNTPYSVINLTAPDPIAGSPDWEDCFESNMRMAVAKKAYMKSMGVDCLITLGDYNSAPVTFTYFVVSLKVGKGAKAMLEDAGEDLSNLQEGNQFSSQVVAGPGGPGFGQSSGLVMIDKSRFNIHFAKRFTLSAKKYESGGSNSTQFSGTYKRFYHKLNCSNKVLTDGTNDVQIRQIKEQDVPIGSRFYALLFNDCPTGSSANPTWQLNQVVTVRR